MEIIITTKHLKCDRYTLFDTAHLGLDSDYFNIEFNDGDGIRISTNSVGGQHPPSYKLGDLLGYILSTFKLTEEEIRKVDEEE